MYILRYIIAATFAIGISIPASPKKGDSASQEQATAAKFRNAEIRNAVIGTAAIGAALVLGSRVSKIADRIQSERNILNQIHIPTTLVPERPILNQIHIPITSSPESKRMVLKARGIHSKILDFISAPALHLGNANKKSLESMRKEFDEVKGVLIAHLNDISNRNKSPDPATKEAAGRILHNYALLEAITEYTPGNPGTLSNVIKEYDSIRKNVFENDWKANWELASYMELELM